MCHISCTLHWKDAVLACSAWLLAQVDCISIYERTCLCRLVFWQGSTDHRGKPGAPGRVATIVPAGQDSTVWGMAYQLAGSPEEQKSTLKAGSPASLYIHRLVLCSFTVRRSP